jgi:hypothetical protein
MGRFAPYDRSKSVADLMSLSGRPLERRTVDFNAKLYDKVRLDAEELGHSAASTPAKAQLWPTDP